MKTKQVVVSIYREDLEIQATFTYNPPCRGSRDSCGGVAGAGPALEPDEPATLEFEHARTVNDEPIELTDSEIDNAEQAAWDSLPMNIGY